MVDDDETRTASGPSFRTQQDLVMTRCMARTLKLVLTCLVVAVLTTSAAFAQQDNSSDREMEGESETTAASEADASEGNDADEPEVEGSDVAISADRPGFSNSADTPPANRFQLEGGLSYTRTVFSTTAGNNRPDSIAQNTFALDALGRYGLSDTFELRLGIVPVSFTSAANQDTTDTTGLGSVTLGAKYALHRGDSVSVAALPTVELASAIDSPTGNASLTGILDIHLLEPVATTINASIGGNSLVSERSNASPRLTYSGAVTFGYGLSDVVGVYGEYYVLGAEEADLNHHVDGGFTYALGNRMQLDLYGDYEISGDNSFQLGAGVAYLFGGGS